MEISVNHTQLHVDTEGAGRPLVVLHGGPGFDQGYLRPGLLPLAEDARLVFPDLRGQGRSAPVPVESCTLEQMADDVAELCATFERPVVFGHSAGGFVALQLALRHPGLASGLILCHTAAALSREPGPPGPAERGGEAAGAAAARLFGGDFSLEVLEAFDRLVLPLYAAPGHEDVPPRLMALSTINAEIAAYFFQRLAPAYDVRADLERIDVPTLVVTGRHDWVCPPAAGRALAAAIPRAELVELDSGHFGFSETPEPFQRAVRAWLSSTGAS
ncbi:alpha/beta fold hydrolase [Solirubrobacter soli]|uniref:alpha/beta fold hydrolase n=1 Tax=Solirubrobacter soli TaxID=363832 RepID=UPI000420D488|nr:alpha/beta hydrolase [Solirubrobacter soli]